MKLSLENLTKAYGGHITLNDLNLDISNVTSVGVIGPSGCGKSTLLRVLSGIENPDSGAISINQLSPVSDKQLFQEKIGYVFQNHNLFPHLTVFKNLQLILQKVKKLNPSTVAETIEGLLTQLQIQSTRDKKPHEISGGQAQRASIARALSTQPDILFLDEPTAALDPLMTKEVLSAVTDLKAQGREFIFVTHEMHFLKEFADYIIFMDDGRIVEHGTPDIFDHPQTLELKQFLSLT